MDRSARESARHAHGPKSGFEAQRYYRREKTKSSGQYNQQRGVEVNRGGERGGEGVSGSGGGDGGTGSAVVEGDEEVLLRPTPKHRSRSTPLVATTSASIKHGRTHELRSPLLPQDSPDSKLQSQSHLQSRSAATNARANAVRTSIQPQLQPPLSPAQDEDEATGAVGVAIRGRFPISSPNPEVCTEASLSPLLSGVIFSELRDAALTEPHLRILPPQKLHS